MSDYDEETRFILQEIDALIERLKSGKLSKLDCKRIAWSVKIMNYLKEGKEDKLEELKPMIEKDFECK